MRRVLILFVVLLPVSAFGAAALRTPVMLPTGWTLTPASGLLAATGTMPQGIALSPDGKTIAVLESGAGPAGLRFFDSASLHETGYLALKGAFGKPVWDSNDHLWIALANLHAVARINATSAAIERTIDTGDTSWPAAIDLSPDGAQLAFSDDTTAHVGLIDLQSGTVAQRIPTDKHPGDLAYSADGTTLAVADRGASTIMLINPATARARSIEVGDHPSALAFAPGGKYLYVALSDDDVLATLDVQTEKITNRVRLGFENVGASPNAVAVAVDGTAFVTCGARNAVAVVAAQHVTGFLPTGWYPDGVAVDKAGRTLYVSNGKGERSHSNPQFSPFTGHREGYIATSLLGSVRAIDLRTNLLSAQTRGGMPVPSLLEHSILHAHGPLRHVIYIIKENRSFDQVLGDIPGVDGDAALLLFGNDITPNQHAMARRFGAFDRAFTNAQVSADGHNWSTAAFANDYLERFWPPDYGNRRLLYDFEDGADASRPHGGYLWDAAVRAHITYRDYGEFVTNPSTTGSEVTTQEQNLKGHISTAYPGFDMEFSDLDRVTIWMREFREYEKSGNLPVLEIIRLPNDHTSGTRAGSLTPQAYVAQNDLAFGEIVDAVSHSKFWKSTAIFAVEDDALNGPDHLDAQRSTYYIASPYAHGGVDHTRYSTASVVRTMELILGLKPLSSYDAAAQPMYHAFTTKGNFKPFTAVRPSVDLKAVNKKTAYGAALSAKMDFRHADAADPDVLNDILYHAVPHK